MKEDKKEPKDKTVFTQLELEYIVMNTLTNLMVVVDHLTAGSEVDLKLVRNSLLKTKPDIIRWIASKETKE